METWPYNILSGPLLEAQIENINSVVRSEVESGVYEQKSRFSRFGQSVKVAFKMNDDDYAAFESWYVHKIKNGTNKFLIKLKIGGGLKEYIAKIINGDYASNFDEPFWDVSFSLEIENNGNIS